jgi:hypothetical protein
LQKADLREDGISGVCRSTCPRWRLYDQVDFRREMRPIAFVEPEAFLGTNPEALVSDCPLPVRQCGNRFYGLRPPPKACWGAC